MKSTQICKINWQHLSASIHYVPGTPNPYRLYEYRIEMHKEYGYPVKHRKQVAKYADLTSTLYHLYRMQLDNEYDHAEYAPV